MSRPAVTTAVDAVAAELRAAIVAGDPAPGQRLREEELAAHYDVARHTVRAVLRLLAAERLVVIEPHRGARVVSLDGSQLRALFELRTALEVEAVRLLIAGEGLDPLPDGVSRAAVELETLCGAPEPDRARIDAAHLALHHALVAAADSPRITQAHAALAAESQVVLRQSRSTLVPHVMAAHHRTLLDELRTTGADALRTHLAQGRAFGDPDVDRHP